MFWHLEPDVGGRELFLHFPGENSVGNKELRELLYLHHQNCLFLPQLFQMLFGRENKNINWKSIKQVW